MTLNHDGVRIVFVEWVDGMVLRFVRSDSGAEYFLDTGDGARVRFTVRSLFNEFQAGRLLSAIARTAR